MLPRDALSKTSALDYADWNYTGILGRVSRVRYRLAVSLFGARKFKRLIEVGSGSGVFLPELTRHCEHLYALDSHREQARVARTLRDFEVPARLVTARLESLPLRPGSFDCVVAVSTVEFLDDVHALCREIQQALSPEGVFIVITPGHSWIVDLGFRWLTAEDAAGHFGTRREQVIPTLLKYFQIERHLRFPSALWGIRLYSGLELRPRFP